MTWLDSLTRATPYTGSKLRPHRARPEPPLARDEDSMTHLIESSKWEDLRVRDALEYLQVLEADPDADDFAIVWARHELQRCLHTVREDILRDG